MSVRSSSGSCSYGIDSAMTTHVLTKEDSPMIAMITRASTLWSLVLAGMLGVLLVVPPASAQQPAEQPSAQPAAPPAAPQQPTPPATEQPSPQPAAPAAPSQPAPPPAGQMPIMQPQPTSVPGRPDIPNAEVS